MPTRYAAIHPWLDQLKGREFYALLGGFGSKMNAARIRRVIAAGMIGNALAGYDFAIYGYFAAQLVATSSRITIRSPSCFRYSAYLRSAI